MNEKLTKLVGKVKLGAKRNAPELLLGAAAVTGIAGVVLACKSTIKANDIREDYKARVLAYDNDICEEYTAEDAKVDIKKATIQMGLDMVKTYAVPAGLLIASGAFVFASYSVQKKRNKALAVALASTTAAYNGLIARLKNGAECGLTAQEVLDGYQGVKKVDENGNEVIEKVQMDPIENLYKFRFDKYSPCWETNKECNLYFINGVENWANDLLRLQGYIFLNDVLDRLGLPRTKAGQIVGWVLNGEGDGYVDFGIVDCETLDNVNYNDNAFDLNFNVDGDILSKFN